MRWLPAIALLLALAPPAAAGPIRVEILPDPLPADPFVVSVYGHYASIHNGTSRRWKEVPFRAGSRQFIPLGPVNVLLNMGVSISIYHPQYFGERARSYDMPLLIRPVGFETFRPRTWKSILAAGEGTENGGPNFLLGQILGQLQGFLLTYLPTMDNAPPDLSASDESLRAHLPLFEELTALAMTEAATKRTDRFYRHGLGSDPGFLRSMEKQEHRMRTEVRNQMHRIREWLSVPRASRVAVRELMQDMRYDKSVGQDLMADSDRAEVSAFLNRYEQDRAAQREPERATSWANPTNHVVYRLRISQPPRTCANVSITADLTGVVTADLGKMTKRIGAKFCRDASGEWRYGTS
jgi:hypothetical protein